MQDAARMRYGLPIRQAWAALPIWLIVNVLMSIGAEAILTDITLRAGYFPSGDDVRPLAYVVLKLTAYFFCLSLGQYLGSFAILPLSHRWVFVSVVGCIVAAAGAGLLFRQWYDGESADILTIMPTGLGYVLAQAALVQKIHRSGRIWLIACLCGLVIGMVCAQLSEALTGDMARYASSGGIAFGMALATGTALISMRTKMAQPDGG